MKPQRVLLACEHSGRVRSAFAALGHDAWSCDLEPADDGGPHLQMDVRGAYANHGPWDLVIAFPPCTHLCVSGAKHFAQKRLDGRQAEGIAFFEWFTRLPGRWAIENPIGIMSSLYRQPDQIIQPHQFGDTARKATCLWLHDLPPLYARRQDQVGHGEMRPLKDGRTMPAWYTSKGRHRQVTFPGIASAMATQWGNPYAEQTSFLTG